MKQIKFRLSAGLVGTPEIERKGGGGGRERERGC